MRVEAAASYVLHIRPYLDSSGLVECFSCEHGLVTLVARGLKRVRSRLVGLIQPFILLELGWVGKSELKTLTTAEAKSYQPKLVREKILVGLYLNELLMRLLQRFDPHPALFYEYDKTINALALSQNKFEQEVHLRMFELNLLAHLGYGLNLKQDAKLANIEDDLLYGYDPVVGIHEVSAFQQTKESVAVSGASITALANGEFDSLEKLKEAKKLMRTILSYYLGYKPLQSRKLFFTAN